MRPQRPPRMLTAATSAAVASIILLFVMVLALALPVLVRGLGAEGGTLFSWTWNVGQKQFGILPMMAGSLILAVLATACAWPLALGLCGLTLAGAAGGRARRGLMLTLNGLIRFMTAVPTVIYGFVAVFLLVPLMREILGRGSGLGLAGAGLVLTILILPTMVLIMEAGLKRRYEAVRLDAAALGFGGLATFWHWVLPRSGSALISALVLGFGRALGDTMISLMLAGNAPQTPAALSDSFRTLTAHMALVTANEAGGEAYNSLFAAGAILLAISCGVSLIARTLRRAPDAVDSEALSAASGLRRPRVFSWPADLAGRVGPKLLAVLGAMGGLICLITFAAIAGLLLYRSWGHLNLQLFFGDVSPLEAVSGRRPVWDGLWPACVGTLSLIGLTMLFVLPPGLGCGIYLAEYAGPGSRKYLGAIMDMAAGVPSIVMGLFGFTLIVLLRRFLPGANTCLLLAAFCLSLLVLPVLVSATKEAAAAVPGELRLSLAALGFAKWPIIKLAVLPMAGRGILGGIILALGRAAEDAAVIMLTGAVANAGFFKGLWAKFQALPFTIYYTAAQYQTQAELDRGFGAALILLIMSAALFAGARLIERSYSRRLGG